MGRTSYSYEKTRCLGLREISNISMVPGWQGDGEIGTANKECNDDHFGREQREGAPGS